MQVKLTNLFSNFIARRAIKERINEYEDRIYSASPWSNVDDGPYYRAITRLENLLEKYNYGD